MLNPWVVVSIVRKGWGDAVLEATMEAGAHGGTVLMGRGIGRNEQMRVFGIQIEPEKEIVLTVVPVELCDTMLESIKRAAGLDAPGHGLAFTLPLDKVIGVVHLVEEDSRRED